MILRWKKKTLSGSITLPASKSLCNRALIIRALARNPFPIENISLAEDSQNLHQNLELLHQKKNGPLTLDVGPAGTNMRFLTAFVATQPGLYILSGSARMHQRPVKPLAEALRQLGAEIEYLEKEGYPPLRIRGKQLTGKRVMLSADVSSQFISALMMIGPALPEGLSISLQGEPVSYSYIRMTGEVMNACGARVRFEGREIWIAPQPYHRDDPLRVEGDWSAASYWYGMLALAEEGRLELPALQKDSFQGDRILSEWMEPFGVKTSFYDTGVIIEKTVSKPVSFNKDFTLVPDLAQTFMVLVAAQGRAGRFSGLKTLRIKETDRLEAMKAELKKCGVRLDVSDDSAGMEPQVLQKALAPVCTYHDHRMAMAFAMLAMHAGSIEIEDHEVVRKSYPGFWEDLEKVGMELTND